MAEAPAIVVEVACALPGRQQVVRLSLVAGTTAREAVRASGLGAAFPELDLERCPLGIYGRVVSGNQVLAAGDRVEIYRPLLADPREARRRATAS